MFLQSNVSVVVESKAGCIHISQKGPSSLTQFTITIKNSNTTKNSTAVEKIEREREKTMLNYRGHFVLVTSFCLHFILKQAA